MVNQRFNRIVNSPFIYLLNYVIQCNSYRYVFRILSLFYVSFQKILCVSTHIEKQRCKQILNPSAFQLIGLEERR